MGFTFYGSRMPPDCNSNYMTPCIVLGVMYMIIGFTLGIAAGIHTENPKRAILRGIMISYGLAT